MRFNNIEIISFTDALGKTYAIRDRRPIPDYVTLFSQIIKQGDEIDEIATRREIYGEGKEADSYKIVEANKETMLDYRFDLSRIKEIKIPQ